MNAPETELDPRRERKLLLGILGLALVLRLLAWAQFADVEQLHGDEIYYARMARSIAAGEGHPGSVRPPLHPYFLAGVFAVTGGSLLAARLAQLVLGLGTVLLVRQLARRDFGARAGLLAAGLAAVAPGLVHATHFLWAEGLAAFLLCATLLATDVHLERGTRRSVLLGGVLLGLLVLNRESWLALLPLLGGWIAWKAPGPPRARVAGALLMFLGCAAPILPWTIRNARLHDRFVLVSTNRWYPIGWGNVYPEDGWYLGTDVERESGFVKNPPELKPISEAAPPLFRELECQAYWKAIAEERIAAAQPAWLFQKLVRNTARLFYTGTQSLRFVLQDWVDVSRMGGWLLLIGDVLGTWLVFGTGLLGLATGRASRLRAPVALALASFVAVHVIANAVPRFAIPLQAPLAVLGGAWLATWSARSRASEVPASGRARRLVGASLVALYLLLPAPLTWCHLRRVLEHLSAPG